MGLPLTSFELILHKVIAADKHTCCDLRSYMFTQLSDAFQDCSTSLLESLRNKLIALEEYEWCAPLQQILNLRQVS